MLKSKKHLILAILLPLIVGAFSALLTSRNMNLYQTIEKPPLAPPAVVFPIVWTILYILMGIASYRILESGATREELFAAGAWYFVQLFMNFFWSIIFFNLHMYLSALIWLVLLYTMVILCTMQFFRMDKIAGWLMIPYNIWMAVAAYLNLAIAFNELFKA